MKAKLIVRLLILAIAMMTWNSWASAQSLLGTTATLPGSSRIWTCVADNATVPAARRSSPPLQGEKVSGPDLSRRVQETTAAKKFATLPEGGLYMFPLVGTNNPIHDFLVDWGLQGYQQGKQVPVRVFVPGDPVQGRMCFDDPNWGRPQSGHTVAGAPCLELPKTVRTVIYRALSTDKQYYDYQPFYLHIIIAFLGCHNPYLSAHWEKARSITVPVTSKTAKIPAPCKDEEDEVYDCVPAEKVAEASCPAPAPQETYLAQRVPTGTWSSDVMGRTVYGGSGGIFLFGQRGRNRNGGFCVGQPPTLPGPTTFLPPGTGPNNPENDLVTPGTGPYLGPKPLAPGSGQRDANKLSSNLITGHPGQVQLASTTCRIGQPGRILRTAADPLRGVRFCVYGDRKDIK